MPSKPKRPVLPSAREEIPSMVYYFSEEEYKRDILLEQQNNLGRASWDVRPTRSLDQTALKPFCHQKNLSMTLITLHKIICKIALAKYNNGVQKGYTVKMKYCTIKVKKIDHSASNTNLILY